MLWKRIVFLFAAILMSGTISACLGPGPTPVLQAEGAKSEPSEAGGEIPAVSGVGDTSTPLHEIEIHIPSLAPGEVVQVGSVELNERTLYFDLKAQAGSGLYVGLHTDQDLADGQDVTWELSMDGTLFFTGNERTVNAKQHIGRHKGLYYVYVGCYSDGAMLQDIGGTIVYGD